MLDIHICDMTSCTVFAVGPDHILAERHFVIVLTTIAFTFPLSLYRNIERLGKVCDTVTQLSCYFVTFLKLNHVCFPTGFLPVNGADTFHPRHCNHQSSYLWTPNV